MKTEIDAAICKVLEGGRFIKGAAVDDFQRALADYTGSRFAVTCGNGTDALQLALMALDLQPGDEVITVPFTFVSTVEVLCLLGLKPVFVDVCEDSFNMDVCQLEAAISPKTRAVLPVHLFGQCADMERILQIARKHNLFVMEDACQSIGAAVTFSDGTVRQAGTMGTVGCTSFFPSKNLGCYGDGGALFTQDAALAEKISMLANHGSQTKYLHTAVGVNSRLDALQAAILSVKLRHLDEFTMSRHQTADFYRQHLADLHWAGLPATMPFTSHVFHQYTLKIKDRDRNDVRRRLASKNIPSMVYYPLPVHLQPGYAHLGYAKGDFPVSERLAEQVLSLPMHTELDVEQRSYIVSTLKNM